MNTTNQTAQYANVDLQNAIASAAHLNSVDLHRLKQFVAEREAKLRAEEIEDARSKILAIAEANNISMEEIRNWTKMFKPHKVVGPVMYRLGDHVWAGRGPRPTWVKEWEINNPGAPLSMLLVK